LSTTSPLRIGQGPGAHASIAAALRGCVQDGDRLFIGTGAGEPRTLIRILIEDVLPLKRDVELMQVSIGGSELVTTLCGGRGHTLRLVAGGSLGRAALNERRANVVPASMGVLEEMISSRELRVDGVLVAGTPGPIEADEVSPGLSLDLGRSAAAAARFRALELNSALPPVRSVPWLRQAFCDIIVESDDSPPTVNPVPPTENQLAIGRAVAGLVTDGAAVELGVGQGLRGVPTALRARADELSITIHTGMITDDVMSLVECGVVSGESPTRRDACVIASVALGSADFYAWLGTRSDVHFVDSSRAHRLSYLLTLPRFLAVNSAAKVDLLGSVDAGGWAATLAGGGLPDFATAGAHSLGSIIALESRDRHGASRIVPAATDVQLHGSCVTHVVTEFGVAKLRGADARTRAARMIAVAHPDDRDGLADVCAEKLGASW
jgi:4-hydroxybutyrate CoA-transferase